MLQAPAGQPFAEMQAELEQLLATPDDPGPTPTLPTPGTTGATVPGTAGAPASRRCATSATSSATAGSSWRRPPSTTSSPGCTWCTPRSRTRGGAPSCCARSSASPPARRRGDGSTGDTGAPDGQRVERDAITRPLYLVYLAKQGTFYPFAPTGAEQRDNELELRLKGMLAEDLPIEPDLSRWFPMWDLPIA